MRYSRLEHRFVQYMPERMNPGLLYVSMEYGTISHLCCCGCGEEVVTPLTPTDWRMTYDGQTISLWPSVGNWSMACRSHYVIERGRVIEAGPWSDERIAAERRRDRNAKARYFGTSERIEEVAPALGVCGGNWVGSGAVRETPVRRWVRQAATLPSRGRA
ncbi:DUF6527 family protein [Myxococcus sp. 1LA]